jgi:hypothetical protein
VPRKLRCLVGLHRWEERVREDAHYFVCANCGKYADAGKAIVRYPGSKP